MIYVILDTNNIVKSVVYDEASYTAAEAERAVIFADTGPIPEVGWKYINGEFIPETVSNALPYLHLSSDKVSIKADGVDYATVTATLKDINGNVLDVTLTDYAIIENYGALEVNFINGVATILFRATPEKSGRIVFDQKDSKRYTVVNPLKIYAVL